MTGLSTYTLAAYVQRHPVRHRHRRDRHVQQSGAQDTVVRPLPCSFAPCDGEPGQGGLVREGVDPADTAELPGERVAVRRQGYQDRRTAELTEQSGGFASPTVVVEGGLVRGGPLRSGASGTRSGGGGGVASVGSAGAVGSR